MERAGTLLRRECGDLHISKRKLRHIEARELVRARRDSARPSLGFASRPPAGTLLHARRNGDFLLEITWPPEIWASLGPGSPGADLPRYAGNQAGEPIAFPSAAEMLETFGMHQGGSQYRRLIGAFRRVFGATIFFGTEVQRERAAVVDEWRFNFISEARSGIRVEPAIGSRRRPVA